MIDCYAYAILKCVYTRADFTVFSPLPGFCVLNSFTQIFINEQCVKERANKKYPGKFC